MIGHSVEIIMLQLSLRLERLEDIKYTVEFSKPLFYLMFAFVFFTHEIYGQV